MRWFSLLLSVALVSCESTYNVQFNNHGSGCSGDGTGGGGASLNCPTRESQISDVPTRATEVFHPLVPDEMNAVADFVFAGGLSTLPNDASQRAEVVAQTITPITEVTETTIDTNYIFRVDGYAPDKAEAVAYINMQTSVPPTRKARLTIVFGASKNLGVREYIVSGVGGTMTLEPAPGVHVFDFNARTRDGPEQAALVEYIYKPFFEDINPELLANFGATWPDGVEHFNTEPLSDDSSGRTDSGQRLRRVRVLYSIPGAWRSKDLHALPIEFLVNAGELNPSTDWSVDDIEEIYWCDEEFISDGDGTAASKLRTYLNANPTSCRIADTEEEIQEFLATIKRDSYPQRLNGPDRQYADRAGPNFYEPEGRRYKVSGRTVSWMGWEVTISGTQRNGPIAFDIKFKGERIAYELAFQDVLLVYSGDSLIHGNTAFMDAAFGIGEWRSLLRSSDCPDTAVYLDNWYWGATGPVEAKESVCIFEAWHPAQQARWRRDNYVDGVRDYHLMIKWGTPAGNYDYETHIGLTLGGSIHVKSGSSGYPQTYYYNPSSATQGGDRRTQFGYRVHESSLAPVHDHTIAFKVDLDIVDGDNTLLAEKYRISPTTSLFGGTRPKKLKNDRMRHVEFDTITDEDNAGMAVDLANPTRFVIQNTNRKNKWGNSRGYKFRFGALDGVSIPDWVEAAAPHSLFNLQITRQKDSERTVTGSFDNFQMFSPTQAMRTGPNDSDKFVNGENIENTDLVQWVTLHTLHLPTAEDYPITNPVASEFWIEPHNFFDESPTLDVPADHITRGGPYDPPRYTTTEPRAEGTCTPPPLEEGPEDHTFSGA